MSVLYLSNLSYPLISAIRGKILRIKNEELGTKNRGGNGDNNHNGKKHRA